MLRIFILGLITVTWTASIREPDCYSRFDYEYKVVQKLVEFENAHKTHVQIDKEQMERIKALEMDIETVNCTAQEKTDTLKKSLDELLETNNEMKAALEESYNRNKNMTVEVENMKHSMQHRDQKVAYSAALDTLSNIQSKQVIVFDEIILNEGGGYDGSSGVFTCPRSGVYLVTFFIGFRDTGIYQFIASLMVNGKNIIEAQVQGKHENQDLQGGNSVVVKLNKGDRVWLQQYWGSQLGSYYGRASSFSGVLIFPEE